MEFRSAEDRGVLIIGVSGRPRLGDVWCAGETGALEKEVRRQLQSGAGRIVFDLSALEFISSAGLRVFMMSAREIRGKGSIGLAGPVPNVKQFLDITAVDRFATIYDTATEGVETLIQSPQ